MNVIGEKLINQNLEHFTGEYTKQIDLTDSAKEIYFFKMELIRNLFFNKNLNYEKNTITFVNASDTFSKCTKQLEYESFRNI